MAFVIHASRELPHDKAQWNTQRQMHVGAQMSDPKSQAELSAAAQWLVDNWHEAVDRSLIGAVRDRFGFDVGQAAKAVALANRIMAGGHGQ